MHKTEYTKTPLSSPITEYAISVGAFKGSNFIISGTATFVAPHLAITAKHVVQHYWREFKRTDIKPNPNLEHTILAGNFNMWAIQMRDQGKTAALWNVKQVFFAGATDIVYLFVEAYSESAKTYTWRLPQVELIPPKVGSRLHCFGYTQTIATLAEDHLTWQCNPYTSVGKVLKIHKLKRDNSHINFPAIHTNARFDPGMSGGPVFNDEGRLCAVIASNLPPTNISEEHVSYAALIWASINTLIDVPYEGMADRGHYTVLELCYANVIKSWNHEKITLDANEAGKYGRIKFDIDIP